LVTNLRSVARWSLGMAAVVLGLVAALVALAAASPAQSAPTRAQASAVCADCSNQAAAQRAADTRDPRRRLLRCSPTTPAAPAGRSRRPSIGSASERQLRKALLELTTFS
jgi:hypothetical protein